MFSSCVALDDVSVFEAAELEAIALLPNKWDNDLDPEVSAQLVQANVRAYLSFREEKGKSKGKGKDKGKLPVRPSRLSLVDRRQGLRELKAKTECHACGRKGHGAHDRECGNVSIQFVHSNFRRTILFFCSSSRSLWHASNILL